MCRDYCERNGFSVADVFVEEGTSAKSLKRHKLLDLLAYCRSARPRVSAIVVHSLSRFSRDVANHHEIRNILLGMGTRLHSVTEKIENTPQGKLMETIVAGLAQYENDAKAERTVQGMKEAHRLGRWTWTAPIGYLSGIRRTPPSLLPDPERADLVRQAFELAASGKHFKADVLRLVSALGLRTHQFNDLRDLTP
jgi:DNA invertase Pin-like site-specific DNA recombinase